MERLEQTLQQKIKHDAAAYVPEKIGEMIPIWVGVPDQVIKKIGDVLHRAIVRRGSIECEKMPERFRDEQRTFDQRVVADEPGIIPYELALKRRETGGRPEDEKEETPDPMQLGVIEQSSHSAFAGGEVFGFAHIEN